MLHFIATDIFIQVISGMHGPNSLKSDKLKEELILYIVLQRISKPSLIPILLANSVILSIVPKKSSMQTAVFLAYFLHKYPYF